jgi:hypothetical protein
MSGADYQESGITLGLLVLLRQPLGVDSYLQATPFQQRVRHLTRFAARDQSGYCGKGKQVQASTVFSTIIDIGQMIVLDTNNNPTKVMGPDKFLPGLQIILEGHRTTSRRASTGCLAGKKSLFFGSDGTFERSVSIIKS